MKGERLRAVHRPPATRYIAHGHRAGPVLTDHHGFVQLSFSLAALARVCAPWYDRDPLFLLFLPDSDQA